MYTHNIATRESFFIKTDGYWMIFYKTIMIEICTINNNKQQIKIVTNLRFSLGASLFFSIADDSIS